jgi:hypothetical protein
VGAAAGAGGVGSGVGDVGDGGTGGDDAAGNLGLGGEEWEGDGEEDRGVLHRPAGQVVRGLRRRG